MKVSTTCVECVLLSSGTGWNMYMQPFLQRFNTNTQTTDWNPEGKTSSNPPDELLKPLRWDVFPDPAVCRLSGDFQHLRRCATLSYSAFSNLYAGPPCCLCHLRLQVATVTWMQGIEQKGAQCLQAWPCTDLTRKHMRVWSSKPFGRWRRCVSQVPAWDPRTI